MSGNVYSKLEEINNIVDKETRAKRLRDLCMQDNNISIIIQRIYHPNYYWDLNEEDLEKLDYQPIHHDTSGSFYQSIKKWDKFTNKVVGLSKEDKLKHLSFLCGSIDKSDVKILLSVVKKKLPFDNLDEEFIVNTLPELFPRSFREKYEVIYEDKVINITPKEIEEPHKKLSVNTFSEVINPIKNIIKDEENISTRGLCKKYFVENEGLERKDYISMFVSYGVTKTVASNYYYDFLKRKKNA